MSEDANVVARLRSVVKRQMRIVAVRNIPDTPVRGYPPKRERRACATGVFGTGSPICVSCWAPYRAQSSAGIGTASALDWQRSLGLRTFCFGIFIMSNLVHNEQVKLAATFWNNLAVGRSWACSSCRRSTRGTRCCSKRSRSAWGSRRQSVCACSRIGGSRGCGTEPRTWAPQLGPQSKLGGRRDNGTCDWFAGRYSAYSFPRAQG